MRPDDPEQTPQPVQGLNHPGDEAGVAAVAWEDLSNREFEAADEFVGLLTLLIGHDGSFDASVDRLCEGSGRRSMPQ
jgi:hypothetical protein